MPLWNELEGTRIADRYPLKALLRSEGRTAWFTTERPGGGEAILSLAESMNDEDALLGRLEAASHLDHPNLLAIFDTGKTTVEDTPLVYAAMERYDQSLPEVLRDRALAEDEAGEVAESLLLGLEAIHRAGLTHGRVEPASVLAVGDKVKLRTDCVQQNRTDHARREDVRGLAATLYAAMTQRSAISGDAVAALPAPFASIIRNGMGGQWTLADVRRAMKGPAVETVRSAGAPARPATPVVSPVAPAVEQGGSAESGASRVEASRGAAADVAAGANGARAGDGAGLVGAAGPAAVAEPAEGEPVVEHETVEHETVEHETGERETGERETGEHETGERERGERERVERATLERARNVGAPLLAAEAAPGLGEAAEPVSGSVTAPGFSEGAGPASRDEIAPVSNAGREEFAGSAGPGAQPDNRDEAARESERRPGAGAQGMAAAGIAAPAGARGPGHGAGAESTRGGAARRPGVTLLALVILAVLVGLFWWIFHRHPAPTRLTEQAPQTVTPAAPNAAKALPGGTSVHPGEAVGQAMGEPGARPAEQVRRTLSKPSAAAPAAGAAAGRGVWHVIVYTYESRDKAQAMAQKIAGDHPDLRPQVFTPTGGAPYFVALGTGTTRAEAFALRDRARAAGLPHDTYAQNYSK
jgi:hypothetical protein